MSQRASQERRRDSRHFCMAVAQAADPRVQSEKASRRITVMRRLVRSANPRVINRRSILARLRTPGLEATISFTRRRRELWGSLRRQSTEEAQS